MSAMDMLPRRTNDEMRKIVYEAIMQIYAEKGQLPCQVTCAHQKEIGAIKESVVKLEAAATSQTDQVRKNSEVLWGNGKPGLVTNMYTVLEILGDLKRLMWVVIGVVVPSMLAGLAYLLLSHASLFI